MTVKQKVYISYQTKAGSRSVVYDLGYEDILPKNMIFTAPGKSKMPFLNRESTLLKANAISIRGHAFSKPSAFGG